MKAKTSSIPQAIAAMSLRSPESAVGFVMWRVVHRFQREMDQALSGCGLTHLQFTTLAMTAWLCREDGRARQADIARQSAIHPMQLSLMLKTLEGKSLIAREPDRQRTNTKIVCITRKGIDTLTEALPRALRIQQRLFGAAGNPGGSLLRALLRADAAPGQDVSSRPERPRGQIRASTGRATRGRRSPSQGRPR